MRYHWENLPPSLQAQRQVLRQIIDAMARARPLQQVILFGSHARAEAGPESDVELCILAEGAEKQIETAVQLRRQLRGIPGRLPLTLVPISPQRWREKKAAGDPFFAAIAREGTTIAAAH